MKELNSYCKPQKTFFDFPKLNLGSVSDDEFTATAMKEDVSVVPDCRFGEEGYVRVSFARANLEKIKRALTILGGIVKKLYSR